jgi:hypothetical protein
MKSGANVYGKTAFCRPKRCLFRFFLLYPPVCLEALPYTESRLLEQWIEGDLKVASILIG